MAEAGTIRVKLAGDTTAFNSAVAKAQKSLVAFKASLLSVKGAIGAIGLQQLGSQFTALARTQIEAETRLEGAIRATNAQFDSKRIKEYAAELQELTTVGDETTISAAALLTSYSLTEDQIVKLLPRLQDLAVGMGKDLPTAARVFGRLVSSGRADLASYGITLTKAQKEVADFGSTTDRLNLALGILGGRFGGVAEAMAQTDFGRLDQAMNTLMDTGEEIGKTLAKPLAFVVELINDAVTGFKRLAGVVAVATELGFDEAFKLIKTLDFSEFEKPIEESTSKAVAQGVKKGLSGGPGAPEIDFSQMDFGAARASIKGQGMANLESLNRAFGATARAAMKEAEIIEANARLRQDVEQQALENSQKVSASMASSVNILTDFGISILKQTKAFQQLEKIIEKAISGVVGIADVILSPVTSLMSSFGGVSKSANSAARALRELGGSQALAREFGNVLDAIAEQGPQFTETLQRTARHDPNIRLGPAVEEFTDLLGDALRALTPEQIEQFRMALESEINNLTDIIAAARLKGETDETIAGFQAELDNLTTALGQLGTETEVASEQFKEMSEQLTNVPTGVKVALSRFQAARGAQSRVPRSHTSGSLVRLPQGATGVTINGDVSISSNDLNQMAEELTREANQNATAQSGPLASRPGTKSIALSPNMGRRAFSGRLRTRK